MIGSAIRLTAVGGILFTVLAACAMDEGETDLTSFPYFMTSQV